MSLRLGGACSPAAAHARLTSPSSPTPQALGADDEAELAEPLIAPEVAISAEEAPRADRPASGSQTAASQPASPAAAPAGGPAAAGEMPEEGLGPDDAAVAHEPFTLGSYVPAPSEQLLAGIWPDDGPSEAGLDPTHASPTAAPGLGNGAFQVQAADDSVLQRIQTKIADKNGIVGMAALADAAPSQALGLNPAPPPDANAASAPSLGPSMVGLGVALGLEQPASKHVSFQEPGSARRVGPSTSMPELPCSEEQAPQAAGETVEGRVQQGRGLYARPPPPQPAAPPRASSEEPRKQKRREGQEGSRRPKGHPPHTSRGGGGLAAAAAAAVAAAPPRPPPGPARSSVDARPPSNPPPPVRLPPVGAPRANDAPEAPPPQRNFQGVRLPALGADARLAEVPQEPVRPLRRHVPGAASAPALPTVQRPTLEEIEQQKVRLAGKMEALSALAACQKNMGKMSAAELQGMLQRLNGGSVEDNTRCMERRLKQVDKFCKRLA